MSKFKVEPGDYVCIQNLDEEQINDILEAFREAGGENRGDIDYMKKYILFDSRDGEIWTRSDDLSMGVTGGIRHVKARDILKDRSNWHPHHDVIVAWAKGAEIQHEWGGEWFDVKTPQWKIEKRYRVKPEPDNTAEIAEIEQEMRKLADRLEKLK